MNLLSISGSGRTGSTLLSLLLTQNDDVFNAGQIRDFWPAYFQSAVCSCGQPLPACTFWSAIAPKVFGSPPNQGLAEMQRLMAAFRQDAAAIPDWTDRNVLAHLSRNHATFLARLGSFLLATQEAAQVDTLLDASKSPEIALAFSLVEGVNLRVLNLVRDPRAVAASWARKQGGQAAVMFTRVWAERQQRLAQWSQILGDRFLMVRYEDLTHDPRLVIEQILAWAKLAPNPDLFTSDNHAEVSWARQHMFPPANETFLAEKKTGIDVVASSSWRKPENHSLHRMVESSIGGQMVHYNYQTGVSDGAPPGTQTTSQPLTSPSGSTNQNFAFLICSERSGSNLISTILGCHSSVKAPPPYHLCRDIGLNLHATLGEGVQSQTWQQMKELIVTRVAQLKSRNAAVQLAQWLNKLDRIEFCEIARFVFCELEGTNARQTVFVKENNLHQMLFFILQCFPNAKFVFQVRDPRDYLVSAMERRSGWLGNKFGSNRHALKVWRDDQLGGLSALAHLGPERVFFQRYEDLISNPEKVLTALCSFLNLDFEAGMLDFHKSDAATHLAKPGGPRENLNKPLIADNFGKYRQRLSKGKIRMVETYVGGLMDRFSYQRDFPETRSPHLLNILLPQILEPLEQYVNGERHPFYSDGFNRDLNCAGTPLLTSYEKATDQLPSNEE